MAVIAIDFDGVLVNGDQVIEGAREAVSLIREHGHRVIISSCNRKEWIEKVLTNSDIRFDHIYGAKDPKPIADSYLDDKAIRFENWLQALVDIDRYVK